MLCSVFQVKSKYTTILYLLFRFAKNEIHAVKIFKIRQSRGEQLKAWTCYMTHCLEKEPQNDICTLAGEDDFAFKKRLKFLRSF